MFNNRSPSRGAPSSSPLHPIRNATCCHIAKSGIRLQEKFFTAASGCASMGLLFPPLQGGIDFGKTQRALPSGVDIVAGLRLYYRSSMVQETFGRLVRR
jgi:hypothetical protein